MNHHSLTSASDLVARARAHYAHDATVLAELDSLERRLGEPLRVALVGSVKAGKSTLLNGLLGERIAPTDSRECTKIVTWYHHGVRPKVVAHTVDDREVTIAARRQNDRFELELAGLHPDEFERLDVTWPAPGVEGITLIDTPGTVSILEQVSHQTHQFLLPEEGAAGADAVIYLLRSLHETDVHYLRSMHERTRYGSASIGSIAVLSRADELGSGRLAAMLSVGEAVERLRSHPDLQGLCETVVPVAGLMGMGAVGLRQADFMTFKRLADRAHDETKALLVTAERFIAAREPWLPAERVRIDLLDRFGMYGIRIAVAVLRGGVADANALAAELTRRSGLDELRRVIDVHFRQRSAELKAHSIVLALHRLLRAYPVADSEELVIAAEEHMIGVHTFREMQLVGRLAGPNVGLPDDMATQLERIIGGHGAGLSARLGVDTDCYSLDELLTLAAQQLEQWRALLANPLLEPAQYEACVIAERSCEEMVLTLMSKLEEVSAVA